MFDNARNNYGDYVVIDLAAHIYLDENRQTQLTFRVENLLDEDYATRGIRQGSLDDGSGTFPFRFLGVPQTVHLSLSRRVGG